MSKAATLWLACSLVLPICSRVSAQTASAHFDPIKEQIGAHIDAWHAAAATADANTYFGMMADDAVYIGTEAGEYWTKPEFVEFARPYFDRDSAWSFTPTSRNIYVSRDGDFAWFDELLDTWMGICAASGVLQRTDDGWRFKHYQLSVTVPNSLISEFIDLVESENVIVND